MNLYKKIRGAIDYVAGFLGYKRSYVAGSNVGPNRLWAPSTTTGDVELTRDWRKVADRARDLARNNSFICDGLRKYVAFTVANALWPQARVRNSDGKGYNSEVNQLIEENFEIWAESCCCNGDSWDDLKKLIARHYKMDGEILIHQVSTPYAPFQLEAIEVDQLDSVVDGTLTNGNVAVRGIEFNGFGKPIAYHIMDQHPGSFIFSTVTRRIPANQIFHIFDKQRVTETRGICHFVSSIIPAYDHDSLKDAIMKLLRVAALQGIYISSEYPEDYTVNSETEQIGTTPNGQAVNQALKYMSPGAIQYLREREKINSFAPTQPTTNQAEFEKSFLRSEAAGFGLSYETFTGDLSNVNYSSLRHGRVNEQALYRQDSNLFVDKFCKPAYKLWMDFSVLAGTLKLPGYFQKKRDFQRVAFNLPAFPWIDPTKEANANQTEIEQGVKTRRDICDSQGKDLDDQLDELEYETQKMKEKGLWVEPKGTLIGGQLNDGTAQQ